MVRIQYVGHSSLLIETSMMIVIDPYLRGKGREGLSRYNPNAALSVKDIEEAGLDVILLTHGHGDHFGQTFELLERTDAKLVASNEVCEFVEKKFDEKRLLRIEPDEKVNIDNLIVSALEAKHKHGMEGFFGDILGVLAYGRYTPCGTNMGYLISVEGKRILHSGDTCIVRGVNNPDIAFLSVDGLRTMDDKEAIDVISRIKPTIAVPIHYRFLRREKLVEKVELVMKQTKAETLFRKMAYGEIIDF
nr:MBL fold metallo-hydrolase [Candidatus Njordarchaeota archaeon]